jgi:hypothetical protein
MKRENLREISEAFHASHCVCECCCEKCHCAHFEKVEARTSVAVEHFEAFLTLWEAAQACVGYVGKNPAAINLQRALNELETVE